MFKRRRVKQVLVREMHILNVSFSAVIQIGDVEGRVDPADYAETYGGYRGASSFITEEIQPAVNLRLHYANQTDEDLSDLNLYGEGVETFRPNTSGGGAR